MEVAWTGISCNQDPKFPRSAWWLWAAISSGLYVPRENHPPNILNNCLMFIKTDFWPLWLTTISSWGRSVKSLSKDFHTIKQTGAIVVSSWLLSISRAQRKYANFWTLIWKKILTSVHGLGVPGIFAQYSCWLDHSPEGSENDVWCILIPVCAELSSSICIEQYWMAG